jgi:hypothetical protein
MGSPPEEHERDSGSFLSAERAGDSPKAMPGRVGGLEGEFWLGWKGKGSEDGRWCCCGGAAPRREPSIFRKFVPWQEVYQRTNGPGRGRVRSSQLPAAWVNADRALKKDPRFFVFDGKGGKA